MKILPQYKGLRIATQKLFLEQRSPLFLASFHIYQVLSCPSASLSNAHSIICPFTGSIAMYFFPRFRNLVRIANRSSPHPSSFFLCPAHAKENIQCTTVVFDLSLGKINGEHHFILRNAHIQRLFHDLRLNSQLPEYTDHMVGICCVSAKTVPLRKENQVNRPSSFFIFGEQFLSFGSIERFGRMIFIDHPSDLNPFKFTITPEHLFLITL